MIYAAILVWYPIRAIPEADIHTGPKQVYVVAPQSFMGGTIIIHTLITIFCFETVYRYIVIFIITLSVNI